MVEVGNKLGLGSTQRSDEVVHVDVGFEAVLHVYDPATATLTNVAIDSGALVEILGVVAFTVDEADQGATDFNGDGDALDLVLHTYDPVTATLTNLGLTFGSFGVFNPDNGFWGTTVSKAGQGATDLDDEITVVMPAEELGVE